MFYINGRIATSSQVSGSTQPNLTNNSSCVLYVGHYRTTADTTNSYAGLIDSVFLWKRALRPSEVMRLYVEPYPMLLQPRPVQTVQYAHNIDYSTVTQTLGPIGIPPGDMGTTSTVNLNTLRPTGIATGLGIGTATLTPGPTTLTTIGYSQGIMGQPFINFVKSQASLSLKIPRKGGYAKPQVGSTIDRQTSLGQNLVHAFMFAEAGGQTFVDSATGRQYTYSGTTKPVWQSNMLGGRAPTVTGTSNTPYIPLNEGWIADAESWSMSFWAMAPSGSNVANRLIYSESIHTGGAGGPSTLHIYYADGTTTLRIFHNGGGTLNVNVGNIADGKWHHVVIRQLNNASREMWFDGLLVQTNTTARALFTPTRSQFFGLNNNDTIQQPYTGGIDCFYTWRRPVSQEEIQRLRYDRYAPIQRSNRIGLAFPISAPTIEPAVAAQIVEPQSWIDPSGFGTPTIEFGDFVHNAGGIATGAAVGTPTIVPGERVVSPTGIITREAFGTASTRSVISPTGISTGLAFGTARTKFTMHVVSVDLSEGVGEPVMQTGVWSIAPPGTTSTEFGDPTILPGVATLNPVEIQAPTGQVSIGAKINLTIYPTGKTSDLAFGTAELTTLARVTLEASGVVSEEGFGTAQIDMTIYPASTASGESYGTAVVLGHNYIDIVGSGIIPGESVNAPGFTMVIRPSGVASGVAFGATAVHAVAFVTLSAAGVASGEAFGEHTTIRRVGAATECTTDTYIIRPQFNKWLAGQGKLGRGAVLPQATKCNLPKTKFRRPGQPDDVTSGV